MYSAYHSYKNTMEGMGRCTIRSLLVRSSAALAFVALLLLSWNIASAEAMLAGGSTDMDTAYGSQSSAPAVHPGGWRLKLKDAAIIGGAAVRLGEIAEPIGPVPPDVWKKLAAVELWAAPPKGRPMNMTRPKIQQAMAHYAREISSLCTYPSSITLQQGGSVLGGDDLRAIVVKTLTPHARTLGDEVYLQDFRLPSAVFLSEVDQFVELEGSHNLVPGRNSLRFAVKDPGGAVVRRTTGTVFIDVWSSLPTAGMPLNKDEVLGPERVVYTRKNLAHIKGEVWDGRGGPWRMQRPVLAGQPIMQADVSVIPTVSKGAAVTMVYEGKNVTLSIPGEALNDGACGESIVVRNLQSKKQFRAIVRDAMTVVVR